MKQTSKRETAPASQPDEVIETDHLVPDPVVWKEFDITSMTLDRWDHDPDLDFPPPIRIRSRKYRSRRLLEEFKARLVRKAIAQRGQKTEAA